MAQVLAGTFATGSLGIGGQVSGPLPIPASKTQMRLTLTGLDASNTVKTQKRTSPGGAWADQTTYNSNQNAVAVTVVPGEEWRVASVAMQAIREIRYALDLQS